MEEGKQILVGDIGDTVDDPYGCFVKMLPLGDCRYGLYDATYETKESKKEDLVFIFWSVAFCSPSVSTCLSDNKLPHCVSPHMSCFSLKGFFYYFDGLI